MGAPHPHTVGANATAATTTSLMTVDGGTSKLAQKMQAMFSGISNTVTDPDLAACFDQFANPGGI